MKNKKGDKKNISVDGIYIVRTLMLTVCVIFILLLVYIIGGLFWVGDGMVGVDNLPKEDSYFSNCSLLEESCLDGKCAFYSWCGDGNYMACTIYDCGGTYGIYTKSMDGEEDMVKKDKPDTKAIEAKKEACRGSMEVLKDECVQGKKEIKAKVVTKGECVIDFFTLIYEKHGAKSSTFEDLGNGEYNIFSNYCGDITKIIPSTKDGLSLSE